MTTLIIIVALWLLASVLLVRRLLKKVLNNYDVMTIEDEAFARVLYTLRKTNVMVSKEDDGIYVRLSGSDVYGANTLEWAKVYSFDQKIRNISNSNTIRIKNKKDKND